MPGTLASTGAVASGPTLAAIALIAIGIPLLLWALFADRSRGRKRCSKCWYDMAGVSSLTCPECGRTARNPRALLRTRRRWKSAALALALIAFGAMSAAGPDAVFIAAHSRLPVPVLNTILRPVDFFAAKAHSAWTTGASTSRPTSLTRLLVAHYNNRLLLDPSLSGAPILGQSVYDLGPEARLMLPGLESAACAGSNPAAVDAIECLQRGRIPGAADSLSRIAFDTPNRLLWRVVAGIRIEQLSKAASSKFFTRCEREGTDAAVLRIAATELSKLDLAAGRRQAVLNRLADTRPDIRRGVLYALIDSSDEPWADERIRALAASDPVDAVRATSLSVLPNIETDPDAFDICRYAALNDESCEVRIAAIRRACGGHPLLKQQAPTPEIHAKLEALYLALRESSYPAITREAEALRRYLDRSPAYQATAEP